MKSTIGIEKIDELKSELEKALLANTALDLKTPSEIGKMLKTLSYTTDVAGRMEVLLKTYGKKSSALIAPTFRVRSPKFVFVTRRRKCAVCEFPIEKGHMVLSVSPAVVCVFCVVLGIQAEIDYLEELTKSMAAHYGVTGAEGQNQSNSQNQGQRPSTPGLNAGQD
jgi:hypothetical protein